MKASVKGPNIKNSNDENGGEAATQEILEKFDKESRVRKLKDKKITILVSIVAVLYALFHIYITTNPMPNLQSRPIHVAVGMALIFILYPGYSKQNRFKVPIYDWILFGLSLSSGFYLLYNYTAIVTTRSGIPNTMDIVFGVMTVLLVLEGARRTTGNILPIVALIFLAYPFISHNLWVPNMLMTRPFDLGDIFGQMYLKTEGLFSTAIGASVQFIFLFILFGAFLAKSGMGQMFNDLALALAGAQKGGPAKVAVISSGLMGSINGSAIANVVGTGNFTIPLMKKVGYHKDFAGAVEASASIGGQILPPVMGATAFIMAEVTGISYRTIAFAALFPAVLYYLAIIFQVHFRANKQNLMSMPKADLPRVKEVLKERGHLLLPIIGLIVLLYNNLPIGLVAFYTILLTIIVASFKKTTRMSLKDIITALEDGAKQSLSVMIACAVVGIIIGVVSLTSSGTVITSSIINIGSGSLFLTLFLTMIASLILGMGLPSIPAYLITATMTAPALLDFGIPVLAAHMFVLYFGIFANITPPVALASFAGAGIAGGNPMRTSFHAIKLALAGFIIPYLFIYNPAMLMIDATNIVATSTEYTTAPIMEIIIIVITSLIGIIGLSSALEGYLFSNLNIAVRFLLGVGSLLLIIPETVTDIIGLVFVIGIFAINFSRRNSNVNVKNLNEKFQ
nr:TRAP transporter permease [Fredinandcohnia onubensis]